jgi:WD repeat-containing protein 61
LQLGVVSLDVNSTGTLLASTSLDSNIRVYDLVNQSLLHTINAGALQAWGLSFSLDNKHVAVGTHSGKVHIWNTETGRVLAAPSPLLLCIFAGSAGANPSGRDTAHAHTGDKVRELDTHGKFITALAFSPSGVYLACGRSGCPFPFLQLAPAVMSQPPRTPHHHTPPAPAAENGNVYIFDYVANKLLHSLPGHAMSVRTLAFSPNSQHLITGSDDKHIHMYDVHHGSCLSTLTGHASWVLGVAYSPDLGHFASW